MANKEDDQPMETEVTEIEENADDDFPRRSKRTPKSKIMGIVRLKPKHDEVTKDEYIDPDFKPEEDPEQKRTKPPVGTTYARRCHLCQKVFISAKALIQHRKTTGCGSDVSKTRIGAPRKYPRTCEDCGQVFVVKHRFYDHRKCYAPCNGVPSNQRTKRLDEKIKCSLCDSELADKKGLIKHVRYMHPETLPEGQRPSDVFPCRYCERVFNRQNSRSYHELTHSGARKDVCDVCGSAFPTASKLRRHALLHSTESLRCPKSINRDCHFIMESMEKFRQHCEKIHDGDQLEPVKNIPKPVRTPKGRTKSKCGKPRVSDVTYTLEELHGSDDSNEAMQVLNQLAEHVEIEEDAAKENQHLVDQTKLQFMKMIHCILCNVVFVERSVVLEHMLEAHGDILEEIEVGGI